MWAAQPSFDFEYRKAQHEALSLTNVPSSPQPRSLQ
jgi:hypothetical protein